MTPHQKSEIDKNARAFINEILSINKKFGMGEVPVDVYENAVSENARVVSSVTARNNRRRPAPTTRKRSVA
jgi:hypothetical protein